MTEVQTQVATIPRTNLNTPTTPKSTYSKLNIARMKFLKSQVVKSGVNSFSKFKYFTLNDILPIATRIFYEVGLTPVFSMNTEYAYLHLFDCDVGEKAISIAFSMPIGIQGKSNEGGEITPLTKGMNGAQNMGAAMTYCRRYLLLATLEISEGGDQT
jgi:hypothetical protein